MSPAANLKTVVGRQRFEIIVDGKEDRPHAGVGTCNGLENSRLSHDNCPPGGESTNFPGSISRLAQCSTAGARRRFHAFATGRSDWADRSDSPGRHDRGGEEGTGASCATKRPTRALVLETAHGHRS